MGVGFGVSSFNSNSLETSIAFHTLSSIPFFLLPQDNCYCELAEAQPNFSQSKLQYLMRKNIFDALDKNVTLYKNS